MEDKKNSYKGIFVFLLLFACVAVVTTFCVAKKINKNSNDNVNDSTSIMISEGDSTEKLKEVEEKKKYIVDDMDGYYFTNNIEIKEQKYQEGETIKYGYTPDEKELDITYFSIDGLKDENVETKINEEIRQAAFDKNLEKDNNCVGKVVKYNISGNYVNILSFTINTTWYYYDGSRYLSSDYEKKYMNYNLVNGEQIKLDELFTSMYPIKNQINITAEEQYLWDEPVTEGDTYTPKYIEYVNKQLDRNYEEWTLRFCEKSEEIEKAVDEGKIMDEASWKKWYYRSAREEKKMQVMQSFEKGKYNFSISDSYITVDVDDVSAKVHLLPNIDNLTLYKKYVTDESIYTNQYDNAIKRQYKIYETDKFKSGWIEDNILLYVEANFGNNSLDDAEYIEASKIISDKVESMKEYLKHDGENVYLINSIASGWVSTFYMLKIPKEEFALHQNKIMNIFFNLDLYYSPLDGVFYEFEDFENQGFEYETYFDSMHIFTEYNGEIAFYYNYELNNDLSKSLISSDTLKYKSIEELNRAYNEIFAYHGHDFKNEDLRNHFLGKIWYKPIKGKTVSIDELSEIENQNRIIIQNRINELKNQN